MKLLTVFVCISVYCANGYTIFPLPGQNAPVNPKFGRFDSSPLSIAQSVTATKIVPFLSKLPPLPSTSNERTRVPEEPNSPSPAFSKPLLVSLSSYPSKAPEIQIAPTPSTLSIYASTPEEPKTFNQNIQSPSRSIAVVTTLATDLLPPQERSKPETKPELIKPLKPEIEAPSKDLLPPKMS